MIGDPVGQVLLNYAPLIVILLVHLKDDPVTTVIRHINMEEAVRIAREKAKIEFAQAIGGLYQFGKMNIPDEAKIHGVQFVPLF